MTNQNDNMFDNTPNDPNQPGGARVYPSPGSPYAPPPAAPQRNNNRTLIIVAVIVVLLLCCCCLGGAGWWMWNNGDQFLTDDFSFVPALTALFV